MKTRLIGYLLGMFLCLGLTGCSEPHGAPVLLPTASPVETLSPMQTITPSPRSFPTATSRPTATALPPATRTRILSYITHYCLSHTSADTPGGSEKRSPEFSLVSRWGAIRRLHKLWGFLLRHGWSNKNGIHEV